MLASPVLGIPYGTEKRFLSSLIVEHLPIPTEMIERLSLLGLHTLGQIRAFSMAALISQFGAIGKTIWEIVNSVEEKGRIPCTFAVADIDQEIVCATEVYTKEQISPAIAILLEKLCRKLEDIGMACRKLNLALDLRNKTFITYSMFLDYILYVMKRFREESLIPRLCRGMSDSVLLYVGNLLNLM
jgi:hypothetical protein